MSEKPTCEELEQRVKELEKPDETNKPIGMMATLRDITDIKQTDKALKESEQRLSNHLLNTPVGAISWDLDFKVTEWNPAAETIFDYTKEEAVGKHAAGLILPEDMKESVAGIFQDLLSERGGTRSTNENITKDGRWIICDWYNTTLKDTDGRVTGVASFVHDITERILFEKSLKESEEKYRSLVESTEDFVYTTDRNGRCLFANNKWLSKHGLEADSYTDKTVYELHPEKTAKVLTERLNHVFETGKSTTYEVKNERENTYYIRTMSPIKGPDGKTIAVTSISKDITERKQAEEALRKINDELEIRIENQTKELEIKSQNLEEVNTALKVLLKKRDEDNEELEEKVLANMNQLVKPILGKLKKSRLDKTQEVLVDILETNFKDIISPFTRTLSGKYLNLTPSEIQIANLLKQGKTTKEIAELLGLSPRTIDVHRKNIRKKLGLTNKKSNLQTHLLTIQ